MVALPSESTSWLAIDVGNSRIKFGVFHAAPQPSALPECATSLTCGRNGPIDWQILRDKLAGTPFRAVIVGSSQEGVNAVLASWPEQLERESLTHFRDSSTFPIEMDVDSPRRVGLDRLLTAVAANRQREPANSAIIVDSGTATTVDLVSSDGVFLGGAILPGLELCAKALHRYTEALPLITMDELLALRDSAPPSAVGKNTRAAISSGIFWGQAGAITHLVTRMTQLTPGVTHQVFLTGGGAELMADYLPSAKHYPYLALQGLVIAAAAAVEADQSSDT